jgi:AcrR family transcriptional regulator
MPERRPYRREPEDKRRDALIAAALELVAAGGSQAATVRAIADRAGVSPGLIRHYFASKDELTREAYRHLMDRMMQTTAAALTAAPTDPLARLAAVVVSQLRPPVVDPVAVGLWAGFLHDVRRDASLRDVHAATYMQFRDLLESLIADLPRAVSPDQLRADAIACNAVIDGLWLEGSMLPDGFAVGELERIGLASVGSILGIDLLSVPKEFQL